MRSHRVTLVLVSLIFLLGPPALHAQIAFDFDKGCSQHKRPGSESYVPTQADTLFVNQVLTRMAAIERPAGMSWPPELHVVNNNAPNACAFSEPDANGSVHSFVIIHTALLRDIIQNNADALALVMGHELGHLLLGHTQTRQPTSFLEVTFGRDQELAADKYGMSWALKAGYAYDKALSVFKRMRADRGEHSWFEALSEDHPSLTDRLAALDKEQASLWRAMSAFDAGVYFLQTEQYPLAERCFRSVTKQFTDSYEAWADLGYALLMEYADALEPADLRHFGIGQIVAGGFYRRPETLEAKVRGINEEVWWDAVGALRESLRRKPDLAASYASLGIAYLIRPSGTDPGKATEYLERADQLVKLDPHLDPEARASVMINLAVAYAAGGNFDKFDLQDKTAESILGELQRGSTPSLLARALSYNRAFRLASSPAVEARRSALATLERYLQTSGSGSAWWELAFERYQQLCKALNITPKTKADFHSGSVPRYRSVVSLQMSKDTALYLGEPIQEVQSRMGVGSAVPIIPGTNLTRIRYPAEGIELLANDKVLAIVVITAQHDIPIRQTAISSSNDQKSLHVGMSKADLDNIVAYDDLIQIIDPDKNYRFYSQLGLAAKILDGRVTELVLVQMPRKES